MKHRNYRLYTVVAILLLAAASATQAQPDKDKGPDYSVRGGEYSVLNNLMMHGVEKVEYVGAEPAEAYGVNYTAAKFLVNSEVRVTGSGEEVCSGSESHCDLVQLAQFEVLVGLDAADRVHDRMLQSVHDYWSDNKPFKWKKADALEHLNYKDGKYIMFQALPGPYGLVRSKRLVWVDGKVIKFEFKRFLRTASSGLYKNLSGRFTENEALENFVGSVIRLRVGGVSIQPRQMKGSFRAEFLKLYDGGAFGGAS
jgi:hypothetical protein